MLLFVRSSLLVSGFLLLFLNPLATFAQTEEPLEIPEVVISSTRLPDRPIDAKTLPAKITVITAQDIQQSGAKTVQEALQWATGIVMYDAVGNSFQQTIDMRGFNAGVVTGTTVFVDGVRMNEPDFNTVNFDLIPYDTIDRIEIIPGASAVYGKNALAGVINIMTKRGPEKHQATNETLFGSFHRAKNTITASGPIGKFDYYTNFARETEGGYRDESKARISRFFGKVGYRPTTESDYTLSYTYVENTLGQAGSLPISQVAINRTRNFTPGDLYANETSVLRLTGRQTLPWGFALNTNGFYRGLNQDQQTNAQPFDAKDNTNAPFNSWGVGGNPRTTNMTQTESKGGTMQLTQDTGFFTHRNTFIAGGEFTTNRFGNRQTSGTKASQRSTGQSSVRQDIVGLYAQDTLNLWSTVILVAGLRHDHDQFSYENNVTPTRNGEKRFNRLTPRVGLTYVLTPRTSLYGNYGEAFRVPTYNELYSLGTFGSNPNLKAVQTKSYEVGLKSSLGSWGEASVALYRTVVKNEILLVCGDQSVCSTSAANANIDRSQRQGIETTLKAKYDQSFDVTMNYTYTQALILSDLTTNPFYTGVNGDIAYLTHIKSGSSFALTPKHRLGVTGNYHPAPGWTVSLQELYVSTQFFTNDDANNQARLPGYFVANVRMAYEQPVPGGRLSGFLMINNLFDRRYSTGGIFANNNLTGNGDPERFVLPAPSLAVYGGLSYRFEGL